MARHDLNVNGQRRRVEADSDSPLLYVLRGQLELRGPKCGCGLGQCGAGTVHIDGQAMRSCVFPVLAVTGKPVTMLEGLGSRPSCRR